MLLLSLRRQERLPPNQLSQNATNTPYINGCSVLAPGEDDFWCTVPSCGNIVSQAGRWRHQGIDISTCQAEVTDFQIAIRVNQQISWFQITMQYSTRVHIFQPAKDLVKEKLNVLVAQNLVRLDYLSQVSLHEIRDYVKFCELLKRPGLQDALDWQNVFVVEQPHNFELTECSKCKNFMFKGFFNFFDGHQICVFIFYWCVFRCDNDTVSTRADRIYDFILDWQLKARAEDFPGTGSICRVRLADLLDLFAAVFGCCCLNHAYYFCWFLPVNYY